MRLSRQTASRCRWLLIAAFPLLAAAVGSVAVHRAGAEEPTAKDKSAVAAPLSAEHSAQMAKSAELFKATVRGLLVKHCLKCHGGETVESEFNLVDRPLLLKGGAQGAAIVPGKSKESLLVKLIEHGDEPPMPFKADKLPAADIAQIAKWIDLGAAYDAPLTAKAADSAAWTRKVLPSTVKKFWAYQPLARPTPPEVKDASWARTPLDRFVLARLDAAKLAPNPAASKQQLIRRAYFDLTGLPPSPAEVEAFVKDDDPAAYDKLLDRLLASPHHGERWARHWLDIARFAESHGFEHDYDRPTAYHYRDFVIQALNRDLPYDTFVKWQIAGDELAPADPLAMAATGYLAAGVHSTQITKKEVEKHRYDEMDDMLATIGTSMLGLTIGCARCHDHKFDAIPQADYYRLLATFTTTVRSEVDVVLDAAEYRQRQEAFDREHEPLAAAVRKYEADELPAKFAEWLKTDEAKRATGDWVLLGVSSSKSEGGATFAPLDDGSLRVGGNNAKHDTYTLVAETSLRGIKAIRIEALADAPLVKGGPGRASNGNFALTDLKITAAPKSGGQPTAIKLSNPRATFEQKGLPIAAAIDANEQSAWAVDPEWGKDHAAAFDLAEPLGDSQPLVLTFTLKFKNNDGHNIGRVRLSASNDVNKGDLRSASISETALAALSAPADSRTAEQSQAIAVWYRTRDAGWRELKRIADEHAAKAPQPKKAKMLVSGDGLAAVRLHTQGEDYLKQTHFLRRGDADQKEVVAAQGFLQVLMPAADAHVRWQQSPDGKPLTPRTALAHWITDVDHGAGGLLARVIVNRLWQHHFGRGLVSTPSDFGERGARPTHPELLDYLAGELIRNKWQLKPLHKLLMTSAAYQQSSRRDEAKLAADRDNLLWWRRPAVRLEAEVLRDSLLDVGGALDRTLFGPGTLNEASKRRSIYFTVKRSQLMPMLQVFDGPDGLQGIAERPQTTIAPQALTLMNSPTVRDAARGLAKRIGGDDKATLEEAVTQGYLTALARRPTDTELTDAVVFLKQQTTDYQSTGKSNARELALADFCQTLFCLNEFIYID